MLAKLFLLTGHRTDQNYIQHFLLGVKMTCFLFFYSNWDIGRIKRKIYYKHLFVVQYKKYIYIYIYNFDTLQ